MDPIKHYLIIPWLAVVLFIPQFTEAAKPSKWASLGNLVGTETGDQERQTLTEIAGILEDKPTDGAFSGLNTDDLQPLTIDAVLLQVLDNNLSVRVGQDYRGVTEQALLEAHAVFDPVFEASFSHQYKTSYKRTFTGTIIKKAFQPWINGSTVFSIPPNPSVTDPQVNEIGFRTQTGPEEEKRKITANPRSANGDKPDQTSMLSASISQLFPWGGSMTLYDNLAYHKVFYDKRGHAWDAPWNNSMGLEFNVPLPGSKEFGKNSAANVSTLLAEYEKDSAFWVVKYEINNVLQQGQDLYWGLVEAYEQLSVAIQYRQLLEKKYTFIDKSRRLKDATRYQWAQIKAEFERAKLLEEQQKQNIITTSNQLGALMESNSGAVAGKLRVPVAYSSTLVKPTDIGVLVQLISVADKESPRIHIARLQENGAAISLNYSRQQDNPDVNFYAAVSQVQDGSQYGYKSATKALGHAFDPDKSIQSYGLSYTYPWGNRLVKANTRIATYFTNDSELNLQDIYDDVHKNISDAYTSVSSAQLLVSIADSREKSSEDAYQHLSRAFNLGEKITVLELIEYMQSLLDARRTMISALVQQKKAEVNLLAAQGILPSFYTSGDTAESDFERYHRMTLRTSTTMKFFVPGT